MSARHPTSLATVALTAWFVIFSLLCLHGGNARAETEDEDLAKGNCYTVECRCIIDRSASELGTLCLPVPKSEHGQRVFGLEWRSSGRRTRPEFVLDRYGQRFAVLRPEVNEDENRLTLGYICDVSLSAGEWKPPAESGDPGQIPDEICREYLRDIPKLYGLGDSTIRARALEVTKPSDSALERVTKIRRFVALHMTYAFDDTWDPAPTVLARGTGSCSEHSFLFSALCRSVGIPTRLVGATVLRGELPHVDDTFHRWVEVYLPEAGWVHVETVGAWDASRPYWSFGAPREPSLILSRGGGDSELMGTGYVRASADTARLPLLEGPTCIWTQAVFDSSEPPAIALNAERFSPLLRHVVAYFNSRRLDKARAVASRVRPGQGSDVFEQAQEVVQEIGRIGKDRLDAGARFRRRSRFAEARDAWEWVMRSYGQEPEARAAKSALRQLMSDPLAKYEIRAADAWRLIVERSDRRDAKWLQRERAKFLETYGGTRAAARLLAED